MLNSKSDFDTRKLEVETYFVFLKNVEDGYTQLSDLRGNKGLLIDTELTTILKANAFLLLYNLVEATIRNSLWDIHEKIISDGINYDKLIIGIRKTLLTKKVSGDFKTSNDALTEQVYRIVEEVLVNSTTLHPSTKDKIPLEGGNLSIKNIRAAFSKYGIGGLYETHEDQLIAFSTTKTNRNLLAHGDKSFKECGQTYSYLELEKHRDYIFEFLERLLVVVDNFILQQLYLE